MKLLCARCTSEDPAERPSIARLIHVFRDMAPREAAALQGLEYLLSVGVISPQSAYPSAVPAPDVQQQQQQQPQQ